MGRFESIGTVQPFLKLKEGVWAEVFKAYDATSKQNVLLKKLKQEYGTDPEIADRFQSEVQLMARIDHPNVVSILSSGKSERVVYFVAEYIEGTSLDALIDTGSLPPYLAAFILHEAALGLQAAHEKNILHRDLKPANILISASGQVKLTDFGMASVLSPEDKQEIRGTLPYLAPELVFEGTPEASTDLFALGATLYEMLAGQRPFRGASPSDIFDQILHHDPLPFLANNPDLPPALLEICGSLLEKDPQRRYSTSQTLIDDLNTFLRPAGTVKADTMLAQYLLDPATFTAPPTASRLPRQSDELQGERSKVLKRPVLNSRTVSYMLLVLAFVSAGFWGIVQLSKNAPVAMVSADSLASSRPASIPENAQATERIPEVTPQPDAPTPLQEEVHSASDPDVQDIELQSNPDTLTIDEPAQSHVVEPAFGELIVLCTPFCDVYVDSTLQGAAPPGLSLQLTPGTHRLTLKNPNLPPYHNDVVVVAGFNDSLKVALRDLVGTVDINVLPWADVYIDSVYHGKIPPTQSFILSPGTHTLRLDHPELGSSTHTLIVGAGERQSQSYNLKKLP